MAPQRRDTKSMVLGFWTRFSRWWAGDEPRGQPAAAASPAAPVRPGPGVLRAPPAATEATLRAAAGPSLRSLATDVGSQTDVAVELAVDADADIDADLHLSTSDDSASTALASDVPTEGAYTAWLFGAGACREAEPTALERDILERVDALSRAEGDQGLLPRMPSTLPKLLGLLRRDDVSVREIADALSHDPALLGEVIRIANSPYYWPSRRLVSVEDAVSVIGQAGLQQLVVRVLVGPVFSVRQGHYSRAACGILWGQSERCAHASAWLRRGYADGFDAYLAGMVANAGLIAAARVLDLHFPAGAPPDTTGFYRDLLLVSARVSASLARRWRFSETVKAVLTERAQPAESAPQSELGRVLGQAERLSRRHVMLPPRILQEGSDTRLPRLAAEDEWCYRELERAFAP